MGTLSQETQMVQNPALGAVLLWRFASAYEEESKTREHIPIPLLFLPLPILLHDETAHLVVSTNRGSGLRAFAAKFSDSRVSKVDLILAINERAIKMRKLSFDSLALAIASRLLSVDVKHGVAIPLSATRAKVGVPPSVRTLVRGAERLGYWCAEVSLHECL